MDCSFEGISLRGFRGDDCVDWGMFSFDWIERGGLGSATMCFRDDVRIGVIGIRDRDFN